MATSDAQQKPGLSDAGRRIPDRTSIETLDELIASLSPHEWEWGPIGDNRIGYCNWCHKLAKITGDDYSAVFAKYRDTVRDRWLAGRADGTVRSSDHARLRTALEGPDL